MDTITHGIAGALLGKAVFRGDNMFSRHPMSRARIVTWSLMLGALFPDSDVFREFCSHNDLLIVTWHRSITHSLVCLPIFAVALAALTRWFVRWRKWDGPSFAALTAIYAIGIFSHILLDLVTSFGSMIWSPLKWSRPAWDLIFIIDFSFSAILLAPQIVAWVYARGEGLQRRALGSWLVFSRATPAVAGLGAFAGAPVSLQAILGVIVVLAVAFLLPALRNWGLQLRLASWNLAGLLLAFGYIGAAIYAHHAALARVDHFASALRLDAQSRGALPFPPSLWNWDGLIRTPRGVYELCMDLGGQTSNVQAANAAEESAATLNYRYYPDSPENSYIDAAKRLPEVQTVLWFGRFPVTRIHTEADAAVVAISDLRFPQTRPDRPASSTYLFLFSLDCRRPSQCCHRPRRQENLFRG